MSRLDEIDLSSGPAESFENPSSGSAKEELAEVEVLRVEKPLAGTEISPRGSASGGAAFVDLPLRPVAAGARAPARMAEPADSAGSALAAPLSARLPAFAADGALVLLLVAAALLAATAGRGRMLDVSGLVWTAVFALYLSFFSTVVPLILFGKTVGMALTGLTARGPRGAAPLTAAESSRRWLGTALTFLSLGIPLLVTHGDRGAPSPGDRLSGRSLCLESQELRVEGRESNAPDSGL